MLAFIATGLATMTAQEKLQEEGGAECPEQCVSDWVICCTTPGGSTYYGRL